MYRNLIRYVPALDTGHPMAERDQLLRALKQVLKLRGTRYSDLARGLGVSEPTVKRILSTGRNALPPPDRICWLLDTHLYDLFPLARGSRAERSLLQTLQAATPPPHPPPRLVIRLL